MPVYATAGKKLYAIWRYGQYTKSWNHAGYTYSYDDAVKVTTAWNKGIGTHNTYYSFNSSQYTSPSRWDTKWIPVFYMYGPQEWGRFLYGYNWEIYDGLRRYYEWWEEREHVMVATTKDKYQFDDYRLSSSQSAMQRSSMSCGSSGKYTSSSGRCV